MKTFDQLKESMGGGVPLTPQELEIQKKMSRLNVRLARKRSQQMQKAKVDDTETAPEQVKEGNKVLFPLGDVHSGESKKKTLVWKKKEKGSSEQVKEAKVEAGRSDYGKASVRNKRKFGKEGEPAVFDASGERGKMIDQRRAEHKAKRGVKEGKGYQPEIEHSKLGDAKKKKDKERESKLPPHLQGDAIGKARKAFAHTNTYEACSWRDELEFVQEGSAAWQRKEGKNKSGGLNEKGRKSYERENPGSDLKAPQPEGGPRKRSFCARMGGVKGPMKKPNGEPTRKALALRKWKC